MEQNNLTGDDVAWFVPHHNKRIIDATARRMGVGPKKNVKYSKYGNTTNGTISICLWEWEDKLKKGDNLIWQLWRGLHGVQFTLNGHISKTT